MAKAIVVFLALWLLVYGLIGVWFDLSNKQKWSFVKSALYSLGVAVIVVVSLLTIVAIF